MSVVLNLIKIKKAMTILNLTFFSSVDSKQDTARAKQSKVLLYYSKDPCLGKYPKFNLWIFNDGRILYKEAYRAKETGEIVSMLSNEEIDDLEKLLENILAPHATFSQRINNQPITTLKSSGKEFEYHVSKIDGPLKVVNNEIERLLGRLLIANLLPE